MGGAVGPYINKESVQKYVNQNVVNYINLFENDPIIVTQQMHPPDHISFLSRHQAEAEQSGAKPLKEFMNQKIDPKTNISIRLLYDTKAIQETSSADQELNIVGMSFQDDMDVESELTLVNQLLWPDNCIAGTNGANLPDSVKVSLEGVKKKIKKF